MPPVLSWSVFSECIWLLDVTQNAIFSLTDLPPGPTIANASHFSAQPTLFQDLMYVCRANFGLAYGIIMQCASRYSTLL